MILQLLEWTNIEFDHRGHRINEIKYWAHCTWKTNVHGGSNISSQRERIGQEFTREASEKLSYFWSNICEIELQSPDGRWIVRPWIQRLENKDHKIRGNTDIDKRSKGLAIPRLLKGEGEESGVENWRIAAQKYRTSKKPSLAQFCWMHYCICQNTKYARGLLGVPCLARFCGDPIFIMNHEGVYWRPPAVSTNISRWF